MIYAIIAVVALIGILFLTGTIQVSYRAATFLGSLEKALARHTAVLRKLKADHAAAVEVIGAEDRNIEAMGNAIKELERNRARINENETAKEKIPLGQPIKAGTPEFKLCRQTLKLFKELVKESNRILSDYAAARRNLKGLPPLRVE